MTDVNPPYRRNGSQYGTLKRRASSPVDRSRVVSCRRLDPLTLTEEYLSNDEQRALDELMVKAIKAYRGTVFDPVHSLEAYIRVCDELEQGGSMRVHTRRLMDKREELELLLDTQKEFSDKDLTVIRNSPVLQRKLLDKLPGKDEKPPLPLHGRSIISPPLTTSSHPSLSPRPSRTTHASHPSANTPQGRILNPLQISASHQPAPHIPYRSPSTIKREPDTRVPSVALPEVTLPRSYGPPPPGQSSFQLSPSSPHGTIPSVARPVEPEGHSSAGQTISAHHYSTSPYALKLDSADARSPGTPITAREVFAAVGQSPAQPSVVASPVDAGPGQPPLPQPSPNTWFIPHHAPGPSGPNPLMFDFPKGTVKYDCPWCDKSYSGAHARDSWCRHAQEKHDLPVLRRKRSFGEISGYSGDGMSRGDRGSSRDERARPVVKKRLQSISLFQTLRWKRGDWVRKTDINRCDRCQCYCQAECMVAPYAKGEACIRCANMKQKCRWSESEKARGMYPPGHLLPIPAHRREQQLQDRAAPWPQVQKTPNGSAGEVDIDRGYASDGEDMAGPSYRRPVISPMADRSTLLRLDAALPPLPPPAPSSLPADAQKQAASRSSSFITNEDQVVGYTGAARCKGCIDDQLDDCIVKQRVCRACRDKDRKCEWTITNKFRSPPTVPPPASIYSLAASDMASTIMPAERVQVPPDRSSSVVLQQVIQLAEELRANKVPDQDVLELITRKLRTKKGFKPGLVEWIEEDKSFYKESLLLLMQEMQQEKYVCREKGTLGDCMEADRRRRRETFPSSFA